MKKRLSDRTIALLSKYPDMFGPFLSGEDLTVRGLAHFINNIDLGCHYRPEVVIYYSIDSNIEDCYSVCYAESDFYEKWGDGHTLEEALYNCLQEASSNFESYNDDCRQNDCRKK